MEIVDLTQDEQMTSQNNSSNTNREDDDEYTIKYSSVVTDDYFQYRLVRIPVWLSRQIGLNRLLSECEWRCIGVQMSRGWMHFDLNPECPHLLKFRKPKGTDHLGMISNSWVPPTQFTSPNLVQAGCRFQSNNN